MQNPLPVQTKHLKRMTDAQGLIHAARGDMPDRFAGYHTAENADALRLCALVSDTIEADIFRTLAKTYYAFLNKARRDDDTVHHRRDAWGKWHDNDQDTLVQSRLALALSAVMVSELPIDMRLSAADWWKQLLAQTKKAHSPVAAANWLLALGQLRSADPGRDLEQAQALASWLVKDCYHSIRSNEWEWFEPHWFPHAANIATAMWRAYKMLGEERYVTVARTTTDFAIDHLFEQDTLMPVGTNGQWSRSTGKARFDQLPAETFSIVEMLCTAHHCTGEDYYANHASLAKQWFTGRNIHGQNMLDAQTGGCYDALTHDDVNDNQGAQAIVAALSTQAVLSSTPVTDTQPIGIPS